MDTQFVLYELASRRAEVTVCPDSVEIVYFDWDQYDGSDEEGKAEMLADLPSHLRSHILEQL